MAKQTGLSDVKIKGLWLWSGAGQRGAKKWNLIPHLRELNLYENIFANSLTGNITLDEALNLPANFPILGEEIVEMDITIPGMRDGSDDGTKYMNPLYMYVHKITNHKLNGPQAVAYSLELVSEQYMNNIHARVSKSYSGKKPNQIALEIWSEHLKPQLRKSLQGTFQPTAELCECVIPNWTPYHAINWLASRSNSYKNPKAANYVFFEGLRGSNFVSLDSLMGGESVILFSLEPAFVDPKKVMRFSKANVIPCDSIHVLHEPEIIKNTNNGCYASKLITHDIVTKKILQHDYDLEASWNDTSHLSKYPPIDFTPLPLWKRPNNSFAPSLLGKKAIKGGTRLNDCTDSAVMFAPKHNQLFSMNPGHQYDNRVEDWKLQRRSQLSLLNGVKFEIQTGALVFLRVGMCADVHMMSPEAYTKHDSFEDKKMSGKCMITAVRHIISQQAGSLEYKVQADLVKDGVG